MLPAVGKSAGRCRGQRCFPAVSGYFWGMKRSDITESVLLDALHRYWGYPALRGSQPETIRSVVSGADTLALMPTGGGKSLTYQLPGLLADGVCLVVTPLVALMKDQVDGLRRRGIPAVAIHSGMSARNIDITLDNCVYGDVKFLYVSPERISGEVFAARVAKMNVNLLAVDEAHCISQWGYDFRPAYLRIARLREIIPDAPVLALTATATRAVREDIRRALDLRNPLVILASFDRPNLLFSVERPRGRTEKDRTLVAFCRERAERSGIIYCSSRRAVEEVCEMLRDEGLAATRYHAGLSAGERERTQDDFLYDRERVMVATNAFGMGIDKSNVSYVVHYNLPLSLENYYQEAGRAGRDGTRAECLLLYSPGDVHTAEFLLSRSEPREDLTIEQRTLLSERDAERLRQMVFYATTTDCLRAHILRYFGEEAPSYCGACGNCLADFEEVDATTEALKVVSCVARIAQRGRSAGAAMIVDVLRGSRGERVRQRGFDTLSTYGIMADVPAARVRAILDELVFRGVLARTGGDYPTIGLAGESGAFLRREAPWDGPFMLKVAKGKPRPERAPAAPKKAHAATDVSELDAAGQELYGRLAALRADLAREQNVPAYIVFSNAALVDMCAKRPASIEEFLGVSGVGAKKAERYGTAFLSEINA